MANADTFPKLLDHNAQRFGGRPAIREKQFGIWQSWTWAETRDEVRALAAGFAALGLRRGDKLAIVGDNRPRLYWSMVAAQAIGAIPCRSIRTPSPPRWRSCSTMARRALPWPRTRSRSTSCWRSRSAARGSSRSSMTRGAACGITDRSSSASTTCWSAAASSGARGRLVRSRGRQGQRRRHLHHALHLRHHRPAQGRGAELRQHDRHLVNSSSSRSSSPTRRSSPTCRWRGSATTSSRSASPTSPASASTARKAAAR